MPLLLEVDSLSKSFAGKPALRDASLAVPQEGGFVSVRGANGSGKTTLLRILAGLLTPDSGSAMLEGEPLSATQHRLKRRIGYCPAGAAAIGFPNANVYENLRFHAGLFGIPAAYFQSRVAELSECMGFEDLLFTPMQKLSSGFQRRVAIARALLHQPRLLLLDEPFANLDAQSCAGLLELLRSYADRESAAVIVAGHAESVPDAMELTLRASPPPMERDR